MSLKMLMGLAGRDNSLQKRTRVEPRMHRHARPPRFSSSLPLFKLLFPFFPFPSPFFSSPSSLLFSPSSLPLSLLPHPSSPQQGPHPSTTDFHLVCTKGYRPSEIRTPQARLQTDWMLHRWLSRADAHVQKQQRPLQLLPSGVRRWSAVVKGVHAACAASLIPEAAHSGILPALAPAEAANVACSIVTRTCTSTCKPRQMD